MHHSCLCGSAENLMFAKPSSQVVGANVFHVPLCRVFFIFNMLKTIWKPIYFIISNIYLISSQFNFNAIQDGIFWGCSRMAGRRGAKMPPPPAPILPKSVTHILQWWNLAYLYVTQRRSKKDMNHVIHPLSSAGISNFSPKISKFCYIKKYRNRLHFDTQFLFILTFLESL